MTGKQDIRALSHQQLTERLQAMQWPAWRARQVIDWLQKGVHSFDQMSNLPAALREQLQQNYILPCVDIISKQVSALDGTVKYGFALHDGEQIESVLMKYHHGWSQCISTQAGCRMGCAFCATGKDGFRRHLTAGEMISEIETAQQDHGIRVSSLVLMGMGEPLDNYDNVIALLEWLSQEGGVQIGMRHISLSTCGLVDKIEQVVRLIRSKGVGVYFVTQSPTDIPEEILGQLGNRIQHALRAFTPKDQKAVRSAAQTFRANPSFSTEQAIMELGTGEALVSFLDPKGAPSVVERAKILFPLSQIGAITDDERRVLMASAPVGIRAYDMAVDRVSAYEVLNEQNVAAEKAAAEAAAAEEEAKRAALEEKERAKKERSGVGRGLLGTLVGAAATSFIRSVSTSLAKSLTGGSKSSGKSILGKATQSATTTATRQIVNQTLKKILK